MGFFHILAVTLVIGIASAQYQSYQPQSFQPSSASASPSQETAKDSNSQSSTPYRYDYSQEEEDEQPVYQQQRRQQQQQQQQNGNNFKKQTFKQQVQEEELEEEEPDRLQLLLEKSTFTCNDRTTGYYADEGLGCEVFHYCQETQKHSWICPEGFSFHQVHLICMPPSGDNICDQSSKYTFVNDYLYKPINMAEHESKPNVTLRYSERYYPENFYLDQRQPDQEQQQQQQHIQQRQPIQVGFGTTRRAPTTATPYRAPSPTPQQQIQQQQAQQQNVYRSPEDINISLQQRRPILFNPASTSRYEEEEYNYEK